MRVEGYDVLRGYEGEIGCLCGCLGEWVYASAERVSGTEIVRPCGAVYSPVGIGYLGSLIFVCNST